ncbi:MAG: PQQ-dependent sugar dehydrogenase [Bdellovibrionales bacterium]
MKWLLLSLAFIALAQGQKTTTYVSEKEKFQVEILTQQKDVVWGFDFISENQMIFSERSGALRLLNISQKAVTDLKGAPPAWVNGQGGLLDVRVHPSSKNKIYLTYSEPVNDGATTAWGIGILVGDQLRDFKKMFSAHKPNNNEIHFGSRLEFDGQGHIFVSVGDRNERNQSQDLSYHMGKVLRFNEDGSIPKDNFFLQTKNAKPEVWSYGHRNPQGLAWDAQKETLWLAEMGPRGGDEINIVRPGANYGWPVITYGREYYGPKIGTTSKEGMEQPVAYWVPSISPSAIAVYNGTKFLNWKGNLFLANLSSQHIRRLEIQNKKVIHQEELLKALNLRFRNIRAGPDGLLYFSTDDGKIGRLIPINDKKVAPAP